MEKKVERKIIELANAGIMPKLCPLLSGMTEHGLIAVNCIEKQCIAFEIRTKCLDDNEAVEKKYCNAFKTNI